MGKKYIIEIEEGKDGVMFCQSGIVSIGMHLEDEEGLRGLGIKSAIPYDTSEAYQRGYETAKHECEDCREVRADAEQELADKAYQRGAEDMREALRLLIDCDEDCLTIPDIFKAFGEGSYHAVVRKHSAMEIIEKIRAYEQEQEEEQIQVWDEVKAFERKPFIVTGFGYGDEDTVYCHGFVTENGISTIAKKDECVKTGRCFSEIAEVLRKMGEG